MLQEMHSSSDKRLRYNLVLAEE